SSETRRATSCLSHAIPRIIQKGNTNTHQGCFLSNARRDSISRSLFTSVPSRSATSGGCPAVRSSPRLAGETAVRISIQLQQFHGHLLLSEDSAGVRHAIERQRAV